MKFFILSNVDKHDKTQLLAKFKKSSSQGSEPPLKFQNFKVALNSMFTNDWVVFDTMIVESSDKEWL